jgi:glucosylceramidase
VHSITVSDTIQQPFDGVGGVLTDSGAWLIYDKLNASQRAAFLEDLFGPAGAGMNIIKTEQGGTGYDVNPATGKPASPYTYDDIPLGTDFSMANFSVGHDDAYIVPLLQDILEINQNLKVFTQPHSPPAWMKTSNDLDKGNMITTPAYEQALADYFVRYAQAYAARHIPIYAQSVQNEPTTTPNTYPGEVLEAGDEANIIGYLGPAFNKAGLGNVKILGWESNWSVGSNGLSVPPGGVDDGVVYPQTLLNDTAIAPYLSGISYHCYGGAPSTQSALKAAYPKTDIWDLECAGGAAGLGWSDYFENYLDQFFLPQVKNWGRSVMWWTLVQNQVGGPQLGACGNDFCTPAITIDTSNSPAKIIYNFPYYILAQIGRFVKPGAYVLSSSDTGIAETAFKNPDGSYVLIAWNGSKNTTPLTVKWRNTSFTYSMYPSSVATFSWSSPNSSSVIVVNDNTTGSDDNQFNYSGSWNYRGQPHSQPNAYHGDSHSSSTSGDYYTLKFNGTQALIYAAKGVQCGIAGFSVDGAPETALDLYSPTRIDNTYLWATPVLAPGTHTVKVRVIGKANTASSSDIVTADRIDVLTATPTTINDNTIGTGQNQFNYVGKWNYRGHQANAYGKDNHWSEVPGDSVTVWFTGIRAIVYGAKDKWNGYGGFSVDNGPESSADLYSSSRVDNYPFWATPLLPYGAHTVKIRVTGNANPASRSHIVPIDRVDVVSE